MGFTASFQMVTFTIEHLAKHQNSSSYWLSADMISPELQKNLRKPFHILSTLLTTGKK